MSDKISSYGGNGVDIRSARSQAAPRAGQSRQADRSPAGPEPRGASADGVKLTDTATNLKQIETRLRSAPDVDTSRVEAVRRRIESGDYQVNAGRLADRLIAFERDRA